MAEENPGNIFDEAGKKQPKRPLRKREEAKPPVAPKPAQGEPVPSDEEVKSMFKRMKEIQEDINAKMLAVYEKSGLSLEEIQDFLKDPKDLPERVKTRIDADIQKIEGEVVSALGAKAKKMAKLVKAKKEGKKRKKKFIGKRKKWLEM